MKSVYLFMAIFLPQIVNANTQGLFWGFDGERKQWHGKIWETELPDFSNASYSHSVEKILSTFEKTTQKSLTPDTKRRAGLKVYTHAGSGLQTPPALVQAVIQALEQRGFSKDEIFIWDVYVNELREAGYYPPLSEMAQGAYFDGVPVLAIENKAQQNAKWFYESPLPQEYTSPLGRELLRPKMGSNSENLRKSFLPYEVLTEVDFWINLPVIANYPRLGLAGTLVNMTLANITNGTRFFNSPSNAPVAIAEIAAIPELQDTHALNILSLEAYQYIGGPHFNANYTDSKPTLYASVDPVILDAIVIPILNVSRTKKGFKSLPELLEMIEYSIQLDIGYGLAQQARIKKIP